MSLKEQIQHEYTKAIISVTQKNEVDLLFTDKIIGLIKKKIDKDIMQFLFAFDIDYDLDYLKSLDGKTTDKLPPEIAFLQALIIFKKGLEKKIEK